MRGRVLSLFCILVFIEAVSAGVAQQADKDGHQGQNQLVRLLQSKGILSDAEAASLLRSGDTAEGNRRLAQILLENGLISPDEYKNAVSSDSGGKPIGARPLDNVIASMDNSGAVQPSASPTAPALIPPQDQAGAIPAVAPLRMLPLAGEAMFKRDALAPVIRIGNDVKLKPYGFIKAN